VEDGPHVAEGSNEEAASIKLGEELGLRHELGDRELQPVRPGLVLPHEIMTTWDDITTKREIPILGIYNNAYSSKPL
jgi:hypothetical protein